MFEDVERSENIVIVKPFVASWPKYRIPVLSLGYGSSWRDRAAWQELLRHLCTADPPVVMHFSFLFNLLHLVGSKSMAYSAGGTWRAAFCWALNDSYEYG